MCDTVDSSCSAKQLAANRANAQKSTGPRTEEGKAAISQNARKAPPVESIEELLETAQRADERDRVQREWIDALRRELRPAGVVQELVFNRIARLAWQLRQVQQCEDLIAQRDRRKLVERRQVVPYSPTGQKLGPVEAADLSRIAMIADEFSRSDDGTNRLAALRRFEASAERSFHRALVELQNLKKAARECETDHEAAAEQTNNFPKQTQFLDAPAGAASFAAGACAAEAPLPGSGCDENKPICNAMRRTSENNGAINMENSTLDGVEPSIGR